MSTVDLAVPPRARPVPMVPGDPTAVAAFAQDLLATAVNLDDFDTFTNDQSVLDGWTGAAAVAYRTRVRNAGADAYAISTAVRQVARAVDVFADELARLRNRRLDLEESRSAYHAQRADLQEDIAAARLLENPPVWELGERVRYLYMTYGSLNHGMDRLESELAAAQQALLDALTAYDSIAKARAATTGQADLAADALKRAGSPTSGADPQAVADWWAGLTDDERYALLVAHPELIGNADGIPAAVRDEANRVMLETDLEALERLEARGELTFEAQDALANARAAQAALRDGATQVDPVTGEPLVPLLHLYDSRAFGGDGKVAISFGNPDTADHVSVIVPGLWSDGAEAEQYASKAHNVYEHARLSDPGSSVASIMWIGYDAPNNGADVFGVAAEGAATRGGELLSRYVDGLRATDTGAEAHLTVVGHSYGSTTTAHAASDHGLAADDIVLVGSPGAGGGVDHASDLGVGADHVWAGNNSRDPVAALADQGWVGLGTVFGGGLGNSITEDEFGANRFRAESTTRNDWVRNFDDHVKYFDQGSESLYNIAHIVVGEYDGVAAAEHTYDPLVLPPQDPEASRTPESMKKWWDDETERWNPQ